jgi:hypothetical protein
MAAVGHIVASCWQGESKVFCKGKRKHDGQKMF